MLLPGDKTTKNHPMIIISNADVYYNDECYICIMMTSSNLRNDKFSYQVTQDMLIKPINVAYSQVRLHLISYILESHIITTGQRNKMKSHEVDRLIDYIRDVSLMDY